MRLWTLIPALMIAALAAGCGDELPQPRTSSAQPSAGAGATGGPVADPAAPKGERMGLPESRQGTKGAEEKPDPGDANDHSSPQHDARKSKSGD